MPTIRDVAAIAGVSATTASHVLSGNTKARVSAELRRKVVEAAQELGYQPKPKEQRRKPLIAVCGERQRTLSDDDLPPFTAEVTVSLLAAAEEAEADVMFFTGTRIGERRSDPRFYTTGPRYDALVVFYAHSEEDRETFVEVGRERPVVALFSDGFGGTVTGVKARNHEIGRLAASYLVGQGYKRFYYMPAPGANEDSRERCEGFREVIERETEARVRLPKGARECAETPTDAAATAPPPREVERVWGKGYAEHVAEDLAGYAAEEDSPVGVFVFADPLAVSVLAWNSPEDKQPGKLGIPAKVGIISTDDINLGRGLLQKIGLTTIPQGVEEICRLGVQVALDLIAGAPRGTTERIAQKPRVDPGWSTERTRV